MTGAEPPSGVLAVDKPVGPTSHDVVQLARRALRTRRVGHAGTLDPFASGLLLLCVGAATRLAEYATALDKRYVAQLRLGVATDTDDRTGTPLHTSAAWEQVSYATLATALEAQRGEVLQLPPQFSAKKVAGERSHRIARSGGTVALRPVPVIIHSVVLRSFDPPFATFDVHCSSGTYVRAIARDAGAALGCGAHLSALRRTAIGGFSADDALPLAELESGAAAALRPPAAAVAHLTHWSVDAADARRLALGQALPRPATLPAGPVAVLHDGRLVAIAEAGERGLRPRKVLAHG